MDETIATADEWISSAKAVALLKGSLGDFTSQREPFDNTRGWKITLARELKAAGYEADWNKVME
jgi:hypothetical protein